MPILQEQKSAIYAYINSFVACALNVAKEKNPGAQPPRNFPFEGVRPGKVGVRPDFSPALPFLLRYYRKICSDPIEGMTWYSTCYLLLADIETVFVYGID